MFAGLLAALTLATGAALALLPGAGAAALLHPSRHVTRVAPPAGCEAVWFDGDGVRLRGWRCAASAPRRGTLVFLHGIADNRASAAGTIARFTPLGYDVVAYDSRAHGESDGDACTYGFHEKTDLSRVVATLAPGPVVLLGISLGAAVALQAAAAEPRVSAVVAAETFADLRSVAAERAPWVIRAGSFGRALRLAERQGRFTVADVSPVRAAATLTTPVFLTHGVADRDTPPAHSRRVFEALAGPKHLELVPGAGHGQSLQPRVWDAIVAWLDQRLPAA